MKRIVRACVSAIFLLVVPAMGWAQVTSSVGLGEAPDDAVQAQLRPFTPARVIEYSRERGDGHGNPQEIEILYQYGDPAGTGKFNYVIAVYTTGFTGAVRSFRRNDGGSFTLAAEPDQDIVVGGTPTALELVDVNNDGRPEVQITGSGLSGRHGGFDLFAWAPDSLHLLTPKGVDTTDAGLFDVDGDGQLEIVGGGPVCNGVDEAEECTAYDYTVYKLTGGIFQKVSTSAPDPTGAADPDGVHNNLVHAGRAFVTPDHVQLSEVLAAPSAQGDLGEVTVRLGNLCAGLAASPGRRDVSVIDLSTLMLGRNIKPLRVAIVPAGTDESSPVSATSCGGRDSFQGAHIEAHFSRKDLLLFLPRLSLSKPLADGDTLQVPVVGRTTTGAPLSASVTLTIKSDQSGK